MSKTTFQTESGIAFPGTSKAVTAQIRQQLFNEIGLSRAQVSEAASYSMAMVVRYALGLSANNASVTVITSDSLAGEVALATTRHLANAGTTPTIWVISEKKELSPDFQHQLNILNRMGFIDKKIILPDISSNDLENINKLILNSHNVIFGVLDGLPPKDDRINPLIEILNEAPTPVHAIDAPFGLDLDTGEPEIMPLYASSTLSLGTVYQGLAAGAEYVGRHYICDISLTGSLYSSSGFDMTPLFSEQPVQKLLNK